MRIALWRYVCCMFAIMALLLYGSCVKNPVTGGRQFALISESQEIAMGQESHPEVLAEFGTVADPTLQDYFSRVGLELAKISHRPAIPWKFTVVDSPVVNAFAVPGGYIYLTRGILAYMNNEAEMAGVLGHEIGHITARHSVTQLSQQQLMGLGLGLGSIFSPTFRQLSDLAQTGLSVLLLKYSRDHERQADQLGIDYMAKAGYDPIQMSRFFQVFERMSSNEGASIPNWLSTHPAPPDRIQATAAAAEKIKRDNPATQFKVNGDALLARIDGVVHGENPREGFVEGGHFYHPDLRFQLDVPQGWKVENTKSSVVFAEPGGNAVVQLTLVPPTAGQTPEAVGSNAARQEGTQFVEGGSLRINGNAAYLGRYRVQDETQTIDILAAFISYGKNVYQLAGMAPASAYAAFARSLDGTVRGFRELTDARILSVQPDRVSVYRARKGETLRSITKSQPQSRITLEALALINRLEPDQVLDAGAPVKLVRLGR
jgi:predicted Zn-dependent protease